MAGKFVVKTASNGETYFRLQAGNGETILKSEMYASKASALNGIESVRKNATDDTRYERKTAASGQFMFNLKAANHQVIGTSETYKSEASREGGIASVKTNAPSATVDDQT
jgi:uncharacterized protein YegP (UPF0339 family)